LGGPLFWRPFPRCRPQRRSSAPSPGGRRQG
jgi:hypothetical protein